MFGLRGDAIPVWALARHVDLGVGERNVNVLPWPRLAMIVPVVVRPARHAVDGGAVEQLARLGERVGRHVVLGDQADDLVAFVTPSEDGPNREEHREISASARATIQRDRLVMSRFPVSDREPTILRQLGTVGC